jgi:tRNA isopentenyl-2-thiomethyl-A-37 hydroxylase MiaE
MKDLGRYEQVNIIECIEAYSLALFTRVLEWSTEEAHAFFASILSSVAGHWQAMLSRRFTLYFYSILTCLTTWKSSSATIIKSYYTFVFSRLMVGYIREV